MARGGTYDIRYSSSDGIGDQVETFRGSLKAAKLRLSQLAAGGQGAVTAQSVSSDRGLFQRPKDSGIWWIRYVDAVGQEHREKVGPKSEARKRYMQRKDEVRSHKFDPERIEKRKLLTLDAAFDHYESEMRGQNRTAGRFEEHKKIWLADFEGYVLDDILPSHIEKWKRNQLVKRKPSTVNRNLSALRRLYTLATRDGKARRNPFLQVKLLKENNQRIRFLSDAEEPVLKKAMEPEDWLLVEVAFMTGLRQEEQFKMQRAWVNFETRFITVPRSKHGEARHVPMNATVERNLRLQLASHTSKWVFPSETTTTPLAANNFVRRYFKKALDAAEPKILDFHWHDLRHTYASRLVMAGVDLYRVKDLLGHKSIVTTMRYAHLAPGYQHDAVAKLERNLSEGERAGVKAPAPESAPTLRPRSQIPRSKKKSL